MLEHDVTYQPTPNGGGMDTSFIGLPHEHAPRRVFSTTATDWQARVDFDRTRSEADRFRHEEVRLMARLVIAQSVLSDHLDAGAGAYGFGGGYASGMGSAVIISN